MTTASAPTIWPIALIASQFTAWSNYDCTCAGFVDDIMAGSFAIRQPKTILAGYCDPNSSMLPTSLQLGLFSFKTRYCSVEHERARKRAITTRQTNDAQ